MNARDAILGRVRQVLGATTDADRERVAERLASRPRGPLVEQDWVVVPRFIERARGMACTINEIAVLTDLPAAVATYLASQGLPSSGVCWRDFATMDWARAGLQIDARAATDTDLVGITGAFCAIAETGTLMLLSGHDTPAVTSLLPETHIAVVYKSRIVPFMEDAWGLLRVELGQAPRAVNFVSGPSRTGDIEQTIVLGAHGPYRVHLILVG